MKTILFVINTMGIGGGEKAILELFNNIDLDEYEVFLYVLTGQGELIEKIPEKIKILNKKYYAVSVLDSRGKIRLLKTVLSAVFSRGIFLKRAGYIVKNLIDMIKKGEIKKDKLLWKILADGAQRIEREFDLAVAYLEGGATYYVDSYVKAKKKAAFIHIDYRLAGYNRKLDEECYLHFDRVYTISETAKKVFLSVYPECKEYTEIFYDLIDVEKIILKAKEEGGFSDPYDGFRILTVGRLVPQKALDVAVNTMKILKTSSKKFRWYVLGEGEMRKKLENQIRMFGLEDDFILLGTVDNPFPYYDQCDVYVHTAYFEGKGSIAIEEAQILGCAVVASEHESIWEQVENGVDGMICRLEPEALAESILDYIEHPEKMIAYGKAASERKHTDQSKEMEKLMRLLY